MRLILGKWLVALLVTLCLGLQILEATGRWDQTLSDTGDEAVIVTIALCIGSAVVVAAAIRARLSLSVVRLLILHRKTTKRPLPVVHLPSAFCDSPPISLRI